MAPSWNTDKAARNRRKHGVRFADAVIVLEDPRARTVLDDASEEERFLTVGQDELGRILVVCWTWRYEDVRLISARKANARERSTYEEG